MPPKPLKIAEIILLIVVVGVGGYFFVRHEMKIGRIGPTPPGCHWIQPQCLKAPCPSELICTGPSPSVLPTPKAVDTSTWLTYTNPTYHITMQYPPFYKYTKRTNAFEAQDVPFEQSDYSNYRDALNNHFKINVYARTLDGYEDANMDYAAGGGDFRYAYSISEGWYAVTIWPNQEEYLQKILPKEYITKSRLKTYVSGTFSQGSAGVGWPEAKVAYIESPDKKFIIRLEVNFHAAEQPTKATDQTIYQILDTLEMRQTTTLNAVYGISGDALDHKTQLTYKAVPNDLNQWPDQFYYVPFTVPYTESPLSAVLKEMIENKPGYFQCGQYMCVNLAGRDAMYRNNLHFNKVTVVNGVASIYLNGELIPVGDLDDTPTQIELAAKQFPSVASVVIYLNGKELEWCPMDCTH